MVEPFQQNYNVLTNMKLSFAYRTFYFNVEFHSKGS